MKKIGIALGGGGARAAAHLGVLEALDDAKIPISFISGSSSGAIVAAAYAADNFDFLKNHAAKVRRRQLFAAADFMVFGLGLFKGVKIKEIIDLITLKKDFKDAKIPVAIIATEADTLKEVIIKDGSLTSAVMASCCIPGLFSPTVCGSKNLIDGGLVNHLPTKVLYDLGADYVIAVETRAQKDHPLIKVGRLTKLRLQKINNKLGFWNEQVDRLKKGEPSKINRWIRGLINSQNEARQKNESYNIFDIIMTSYNSVVNGVALDNLKKTRYDILIRPDVESFGRSEFHRADELIKIGYQAGKIAAEKIKKEIA